MNISNLRITSSWKEESKYVYFDETRFDEWFGEERTYTYKFEVRKFVAFDNKETWYVFCKDVLETVDGVVTHVTEEYWDGTSETYDNNLSRTPTGMKLIELLKKDFSI
jgi:hypothetical protein